MNRGCRSQELPAIFRAKIGGDPISALPKNAGAPDRYALEGDPFSILR